MAKKPDSTWIDSAKVRKDIYDFNQAVKAVYTAYRWHDGMVIPMSMDCIKSSPLFINSMFIHGRYEHPFPFLEDSVIDPEGLNKALKAKCTDYSIRDNVHYLSAVDKEGKLVEESTGTTMTEFQISDMAHYPGIVKMYELSKESPVAEYNLTEDDIATLNDGQVFEKQIDNNINLIVYKELFPVIKKVDSINISLFDKKDLPKNVYCMRIKSNASTWTFYSMHHILCWK